MIHNVLTDRSKFPFNEGTNNLITLTFFVNAFHSTTIVDRFIGDLINFSFSTKTTKEIVMVLFFFVLNKQNTQFLFSHYVLVHCIVDVMFEHETIFQTLDINSDYCTDRIGQ